MFIREGNNAPDFKVICMAILLYILITGLISLIIFPAWFITIKKFAGKPYLTLFLWNLIPWVIITVLGELTVGVVSGHVHGSYRHGWFQLLLTSTVFTTISYWYTYHKLLKNHL
jgi:hypothetical protein